MKSEEPPVIPPYDSDENLLQDDNVDEQEDESDEEEVSLGMDIFIYGRNCFQIFFGDLPTWGGNLGPKLRPGGGFFGP